MKRFSTILFGVMCIILSGICTYTVYATITTTLTAQNKIFFNAPDEIFFRATVEVVYAKSNSLIVTDTVDHSGVVGKHNPEKNTIILNDGFKFTTSERTIWYNLKIENFSDFPISINVFLGAMENQYITNEISPEGQVTIEKQDYDADVIAPSKTIKVATSINSVKNSFVFDNPIYVDISRAD